jgi:[ribosomal protein S5]-alanine N-acetyltransferase
MELHTQRLVLREFRRADVDTVFRYQSRPEYLEHYGRAAPTREDVSSFVAMLCRWAEESPRTKVQLAITLEDRVIGTCGVRQDSPDANDAELGCELDPQFWGHGYAREACRAILVFGFETLGLETILARTLPANHRAIRLAEDLGFRRIGLGLYATGR